MVRFDSNDCYISQLEALLRALPRTQSRDAIPSNCELIARVGQSDIVIRMLEQILETDTLLAKIASRSYRHINHFDKIVLVDTNTPDSYRITLHLWCPPYSEAEICDELIHDHRFDFWSTILVGVLRSENFTVDEQEGQIFRSYRYVPEVRSKTFEDFYELRGKCGLRRSSLQEEVSGATYFLSAPSIHRIVLPQTEMTCSMVLRGPRLRPYSTVFNTSYPTTNTRFENAMFTKRELAQKLTNLLSEIKLRRALSEVGQAPRKPVARAELVGTPWVIEA